eukprot:TRINITY_DN28971_c0_g1_i1.p1 TRINITY_DN28971_c0_g1~~TRINITY_DN28971_c0_g1_i1.p1  ORF type:complete len:424 (-),score=98.27 TRINITY_DN28971_c0_g1_i1:16-1287(-)
MIPALAVLRSPAATGYPGSLRSRAPANSDESFAASSKTTWQQKHLKQQDEASSHVLPESKKLTELEKVEEVLKGNANRQTQQQSVAMTAEESVHQMSVQHRVSSEVLEAKIGPWKAAVHAQKQDLAAASTSKLLKTDQQDDGAVNLAEMAKRRGQDFKSLLSKDDALSLQSELLTAFTAPSFQKKLHELARLQGAPEERSMEYTSTIAFQKLVQSVQLPVFLDYGLAASDDGVTDMLQMSLDFGDDADIYVNCEAIKEALFDASAPAPLPQHLEGIRHGKKPTCKEDVLDLLQSLLLNYSRPRFQRAMERLKELEPNLDHKAGGYYHLIGRVEICSKIQQKLLPLWGFDASQQGVRDMILVCTQYLDDPEVTRLFDLINEKLGMSHLACLRFRKFAVGLAATTKPLEGQRLPGPEHANLKVVS